LVHVAGAAQAYVVGDSPARWARDLRQSVRMMLGTEYEVDLAPKPPPPPPPTPEPEQDPTPAPKPVMRAAKTASEPVEPPPAAAQAGKILTQEPDPDAPVDLTGDGFVTGNADSYAGGVTAANGTSDKAVRNPSAAATGVVGGTGKPKAEAAAVDKSKPAGLAGDTNWNCAFPPEADADQIDRQNVRVIVTVRADGTPESVRVMEDPGHGFARAARDCAMHRRFAPAYDREGSPILASTPPITVKFIRD
jgi:periplasmic protein TonB